MLQHTVALMAAAQIPITPPIINSFCDSQLDFQTDPSGAVIAEALNYTLCMDVTAKSFSMECRKDSRCPSGPNLHKAVYSGGVTYNVDWDGTCTKKPCPNLAECDPPNGMPFSFLILDDDSRGIAQRIGTAVIDGVAVDHWQHVRGVGMVMNWFLRNISTAPSEPKALVRNAFNHRCTCMYTFTGYALVRPAGRVRDIMMLTCVCLLVATASRGNQLVWESGTSAKTG